jgi:YD repeat-containing protein
MNLKNHRMDELDLATTDEICAKAITVLRRIGFPVVALFLFLYCREGYSQSYQAPQLTSVNDQIQTPIPGAGHDYNRLLGETVNYSNGSVNLQIAFPVRKGRGITLPLKLSYNSGSVNQVDTQSVTGNVPAWDDPISDPGPHGWDSGFPVRATAQIWSQSAHVDSFHTAYPCDYQSGMTFTGMDGVTHNLYVDAGSPSTQPPATIPSNDVYICAASFTQPPTGDGQVIATINPSQAATNLTGSGTNFTSVPFTVMDKEGTTYSFAPSITYPGGESGGYFLPMLIEDRNGNQINVSSGLDTLGLPISTGTVSGATQTLTVNGMTFTETWGTENVNFNVAVSGGSGNANITCQAWPSTASGTSNVTGSRSILSSVLLPDNRSYTLYYGANNPNDSSILNNYGLINEIVYPGGGWVKYTWELPLASPTTDSQYNEQASFGGTQFINDQAMPASTNCIWQYQAPVLVKRQVSFDGQTIAQVQQFTYSTKWQYGSNGISNGWTQKTTTVTTTDNLRGGISSKTIYTYSPYTVLAQPLSTGANANQLPMEATIQYYDWGQSTLLKTVQKTWLDQFNQASETTTYNTAGGARVSGKFYKYVSNLCSSIQLPFDTSPEISTNPVSSLIYLSEEDDYDYGNGRLGPLSKKIIYNYQCFNAPFPNAPAPVTTIPPQVSGITIEDGSGTIRAATRYGYDGGSLSSPTSVPVQHDTNYVSGPSVRGNLTSATKCSTLPSSPTAACSGPTTTFAYDYSGQPSSMTDPLGNPPTKFSFTGGSDTGHTNAYLTNITYADGLQKTFTYNYVIGYPLTATDENSQTTTYKYDTNAECSEITDGLYRLGEVDSPDLGLTQYCYNDADHTVTKQVTIDSSGDKDTATTTSDGMGHPTLTQQSDPDGQTSINTTYDGEGQVFSVTNPYRGTTVPSNTTVFQFYDALGRRVETEEQDTTTYLKWSYSGIGETSSGVVPSPTRTSSQLGSVAGNARPGIWVDFTDERGNNWQRTSDVFGNLLEVMEPNGSSQSASMETDYLYDVLNNLTSVTQNGGANGSSAARRRQFSYDNISELVSAFNPETGTIGYAYDLDGNVHTKTDARGIITAYGYDTRNRLLSKTYQNDSSGTPASCYQYGEVSDPVNYTGGRLVNSWTQTSQSCPSTFSTYLTRRNIEKYDPMGRLKLEQQFTPASQATGAVYSPQYSYDLAGNLVSSTDGITPSPTNPGAKLTITTQFCSAGRAQTVTSNWSDTTHPNILFSPSGASSSACENPSTAQYEPFGGLLNAAFGSALTFIRTYDEKMRVTSELDQGNGTRPATPASATVTITGSEQSQ